MSRLMFDEKKVTSARNLPPTDAAAVAPAFGAGGPRSGCAGAPPRIDAASLSKRPEGGRFFTFQEVSGLSITSL